MIASKPIPHGQIETYTTADIADSIDKRYQTDNQQTYNDATSSIQTQLNTKLSGYNYENTTSSATLTGTTSETQLIQVTIPANTFSSGDLLKFLTIFKKTGVAGTATLRARLSTSATMPTGAFGIIAIYTTSATLLFVPFQRNSLSIKSGTLTGFDFSILSSNDLAGNSNSLSSLTFDVTVTQYFYISATLSNAADSIYLNSIQITNF